MLGFVNINNTESTVYTVPANRQALLYVDVNPISENPRIIVKINNNNYWQGTLYNFASFKFALDANDQIRIWSDGNINVFVHGTVVTAS